MLAQTHLAQAPGEQRQSWLARWLPPAASAPTYTLVEGSGSLETPGSHSRLVKTSEGRNTLNNAGSTQLQLRHDILHIHQLVWASGVSCVFIAAFVFSISVLLVKLTAGRVPVFEITLARSGLSLAVSVAIARVRGVSPVFGRTEHRAWLVLRGLTGALAMTCYYGSLLLMPMADAVTLFFLNPALTAVLAWALRGEPLGALGALGCVSSLAGMVCLAHPPFLFGGHQSWGAARLAGTALGLLSALFASLAFICIRGIGRREPALVVAIWFHFSTVAISAPPLALGWPQRAAPLTPHDLLLLLGVAATSFAGQLLLTRGFQLETASRASSINFCQVVFSYVFGVALLGEHLSFFGLVGSALIACGVTAVNAKPGAAAGAAKAAPASGDTAAAEAVPLTPMGCAGGKDAGDALAGRARAPAAPGGVCVVPSAAGAGGLANGGEVCVQLSAAACAGGAGGGVDDAHDSLRGWGSGTSFLGDAANEASAHQGGGGGVAAPEHGFFDPQPGSCMAPDAVQGGVQSWDNGGSGRELSPPVSHNPPRFWSDQEAVAPPALAGQDPGVSAAAWHLPSGGAAVEPGGTQVPAHEQQQTTT